MRKKLVAGNWKMHGSLQSNAALLAGIKAGMSGLACEVLLCVPFPYLAQVKSETEGSFLASVSYTHLTLPTIYSV